MGPTTSPTASPTTVSPTTSPTASPTTSSPTTSSPTTECLGIKIVLTNDNKDEIFFQNASNKNIVECFDTSEVTNMDSFLKESSINADLSSCDVSSVTSMLE